MYNNTSNGTVAEEECFKKKKKERKRKKVPKLSTAGETEQRI